MAKILRSVTLVALLFVGVQAFEPAQNQAEQLRIAKSDRRWAKGLLGVGTACIAVVVLGTLYFYNHPELMPEHLRNR
jgi:hypothetical protein